MSYLTSIPASAFPADLDWRDAQLLHRNVMGLFPANLPVTAGHDKRATAGILFRVEPDGRGLLIRSAIQPSRFPAGSATRMIPDELHLDSGRRVRFRVAVNAIRRSDTLGRKRSTPAPDVAAWLDERIGRALAPVAILNSRRSNTLQKAAKLVITTVDGVATVADSEELDRLLQFGVGRAKAYGCGLLTLAGAA